MLMTGLKMAYNNSEISSFHAVFYKGSRFLTFFIYSKSRNTNCFLAYFAEDTYLSVKNRLINGNISREERIEIMMNNSKTSLCSTENINSRKSVECHFELEGNGTLVFFPETTKSGEFTIYSHFIQFDSIQELVLTILMYFGIVMLFFNIILYSKIFSYCCMKCCCKDKLAIIENEYDNMHPNVHNDTNLDNIFNDQDQIIVDTPATTATNNNNNPGQLNPLIEFNFETPYTFNNLLNIPRFFELRILQGTQNLNETNRQFIPVFTRCSNIAFSL